MPKKSKEQRAREKQARERRRRADRALCPVEAASILGIQVRRIAAAMRGAGVSEQLTSAQARKYKSNPATTPSWLSPLLASAEARREARAIGAAKWDGDGAGVVDYDMTPGPGWRPAVAPSVTAGLEEWWATQPDTSIASLWAQAFSVFDAVVAGVGESTRIVTLSTQTPTVVEGGNFDVHSSCPDDPWGLSTYLAGSKEVWITGSPETYVPMIACSLIYGGSIVVRDFSPTETDRITGLPLKTVTAYSVGNFQVDGLSEAEVFSAFCTDNVTGEPLPPEPAVRYAASPPLI